MQAELLVVNAVVFSTLAIGLAVRFRRRPHENEGTWVVYRKLETTLTKRFPDLPQGFTLREGLTRARASASGIDWVSLENELGSYEAFRFGNGPQPAGPNIETVKLLRTLGGGRL
jgi:hypothetical protein